MKTLTKVLAGAALSITASVANAGNIFMTGHDVLLHGGQRGYDNVILEYLRNGDGAAGDYDIALLRGFSGSVGAPGTDSFSSFGTTTTRDIADFSALDAAAIADFNALLASVDVVIIPSHTSCGGCDLSTADADTLEGLTGEITSFFNAGGDLWVNSGAGDSTFYDFLPASVATTGPPISGSSGFTCTADGVAIGINCSASGAGGSHINGFPTHNRFTGFDSDFTVFETRGTSEFISIGLLDGIIGTDDIGTDDSTDGSTDIPAPGTLFLFSSVLLGLGALRRKKA